MEYLNPFWVEGAKRCCPLILESLCLKGLEVNACEVALPCSDGFRD
jgi:hypothetical protein